MKFVHHVLRSLGDRTGLTAKERRRFERFEVGSPIKVYVRDETYDGEVVNISPIGAMIKSTCPVEFHERITIEHDAAGRVDGEVARIFSGGFAIRYDPSRLSVEFTLTSLRTKVS